MLSSVSISTVYFLRNLSKLRYSIPKLAYSNKLYFIFVLVTYQYIYDILKLMGLNMGCHFANNAHLERKKTLVNMTFRSHPQAICLSFSLSFFSFFLFNESESAISVFFLNINTSNILPNFKENIDLCATF